MRIEGHYAVPQDTEWAFDPDGVVWMLQSRPVTTKLAEEETLEPVAESGSGEPILHGLAASPGVASGNARVLTSIAEAAKLADGDVLVAQMTAPDWVPLMRRASAIVTDRGGSTCHAAIVSRELGIPAVVGAEFATSKLRDGQVVTVDGGRRTTSRPRGR